MLADCDVIATRDVTVCGDTFTNCHIGRIDESKTIRVPFSMLVDTLVLIKLDNRDEALFGYATCNLSENFIMVNEKLGKWQCKLFKRDGLFLANIGGLGEGPGEYLDTPNETIINEKLGLLTMYPSNCQHVYEFDMEGNFLRDIPLAFKNSYGSVNIDYENDNMLVAQTYYQNSAYQSGPPIWIQDMQGNGLWKVTEPIAPMPGGAADKFVLYSRDADGMEIYYNRYIAEPDTSYYIDMRKHRVIPRFTATFEDDVPRHEYLRIGRYYFIKPSNFIGSSSEWDSKNRLVILDSETLKGGYCEVYNDFLGGIDLRIDEYLANNDGEFGYVIDPGDLLEKVNARLEVEGISKSDRQYLIGLLGSIDPDDNNYIIHGNHKQHPK